MSEHGASFDRAQRAHDRAEPEYYEAPEQDIFDIMDIHHTSTKSVDMWSFPVNITKMKQNHRYHASIDIYTGSGTTAIEALNDCIEQINGDIE